MARVFVLETWIKIETRIEVANWCADGSTFEFESVVYRTTVLLFYRILLDCLFEQLIVRDNVQVYYN